MAAAAEVAQVRYQSVGIRLVAVLIDGVILAVVTGLLALPGLGYNVLHWRFHFDPGGFPFNGFVVGLVYYTLMEGGLGQTVGKMAVGIQVVMEDGTRLTWQAAFVRNVLRFIDALFLYLVAAVFVLNSPRRQRLGDRLARTVVIMKPSPPPGGGRTDSAAPRQEYPTPPGTPPPPPPAQPAARPEEPTAPADGPFR